MPVALWPKKRGTWRRLREPTDKFAVYFAVALIPVVILSMILGNWAEAPGINLITCLLLSALWLWAIRSLWLGVYVSEDGLRIVNPRKTWWVNWSEVSGFSAGFPEGRWRKDQPVLTTTSGQRIPLTAIMAPQPWTRPNNDFAENALKTLASYLETARESDFRLPASHIKQDEPAENGSG